MRAAGYTRKSFWVYTGMLARLRYQWLMHPIPAYDGLYSITEEGQVFSHRKKRFLKPVKGNRGYLTVTLCRSQRSEQRRFQIHRLMARIFLGANATNFVDHKNRAKHDNRLSNLRLCTKADNQRNQGVRCDNTSGFKGVSFDGSTRGLKNKLWKASVSFNGKRVTVGRFSTAAEAARAYNAAALKVHGEFAFLNMV